MTTNNPRPPASSRAPLVPVTDELEALECLIDDDARALRRFASVSHARPLLVQIRARGQFHTDQLERLLWCATCLPE